MRSESSNPIVEPRSSTGRRTLERILEAAEEIFVRYGYEGARIDEIAQRAGVRKANIYYYFEGKEALYRAVVERVRQVLLDGVAEFLGREYSSPWEQLDHFLEFFFDLAARYRGLVALAYGELLHPPRQGGGAVSELIGELARSGAALIEEGIARGAFRAQDPVQTVLTLEGALFHYFLIPEERIHAQTGRGKFAPANLEARKRHLTELLRRLLGP